MDKESAELPVLMGQSGPLDGQRWVIKETLTIGREPSCDVVIPDRQVSRFHARLSNSPRGVLLEDLGSKNGTYYGGKQLEAPAFVSDGELIQVALIQNFVFLSSDSTMPLEASGVVQREKRSRLTLDIPARRVWINQQEVLPPLSVPQFRMLQILYEQPGQVVSRNEVIQVVWQEEEIAGVSEQALDAMIRRLRDRLAAIDPDHEYLVTVRGHGLRLDNPQA
jgi:pSer/pThr/pTyr-binding forkhead associated (FHA) protein